MDEAKREPIRTNLSAHVQPIHIENVPRVVGFPMHNVKQGENVLVMLKAQMTSAHPDFSLFADQLWDHFASRVLICCPMVCNYFATLHADESADLYLNVPFVAEMMSKRSFGAGEAVKRSDIADVRRVVFPGVEVRDTDNVVCCFKVNWNFGMLFDFSVVDLDATKRDVDDIWRALGGLYRSLLFEGAYAAIQSEDSSQLLRAKGWFPFVEILGGEFEELSRIHTSGFEVEGRVQKVLAKFDAGRIAKISSKWWQNPLFEAKKSILQAGLNAFSEGGADGVILCLKTLLTEIHGIMTLDYFRETGAVGGTSPKLIQHLRERGTARTAGEDSLFFPRDFATHLREAVFPSFDLAAGEVALSRHTLSHGVAKPDEYTRERALQAILILDQIYFYYGHTSSRTG